MPGMSLKRIGTASISPKIVHHILDVDGCDSVDRCIFPIVKAIMTYGTDCHYW